MHYIKNIWLGPLRFGGLSGCPDRLYWRVRPECVRFPQVKTGRHAAFMGVPRCPWLVGFMAPKAHELNMPHHRRNSQDAICDCVWCCDHVERHVMFYFRPFFLSCKARAFYPCEDTTFFASCIFYSWNYFPWTSFFYLACDAFYISIECF